jgi:membrane protein DedA with SNARE-associated domain
MDRTIRPPPSPPIRAMLDVQWLYEGGSYLGIVVFLILTGCGLPIPEEVAIVYAGVASAGQELSVPLALGSCLVGAILGDCIMYGIGARLGQSWIRRHPLYCRWMDLDRERHMENLIRRHGLKVFFLARFMVGVRGPLYVAAGVLRVPFRTFLLVDLVCASIVIGVFFSLSYFFGQPVLAWIEHGEWWVTAIVVAAAVVVVAIWWLRRRRGRVQSAVETVAGEQPQRKRVLTTTPE